MGKIELNRWPLLGVIIPSVLIVFIGHGTYSFIIGPEVDELTASYERKWVIFYLVMIWISYAMAIFKSPGYVPENYKPAETGEWIRWCRKCNNYKPERSHHCRRCKRCVLMMDHHCPWTMNCVGHANMPHFIRFLCWTQLGLWYTFFIQCRYASKLYAMKDLPSYLLPTHRIVILCLELPVTFFVAFTLFLLWVRVMKNAFNGTTLIETWQQDRAERLIRRRKCDPKGTAEFPYDIDPWNNCVLAWGYPWCWMVPCAEAEGDGLHFEKNEAADDGCFWPPDHKDEHDPNGSRDESEVQESVGRSTDVDFYHESKYISYMGETIRDFGVEN